MVYKWCVSDMDGTLLNSNGIISKENETALKKLKKTGVEVIIASGKIDLLMKKVIKQLELNGLIICCNGALVKDIKTGEVFYEKYIDKKTSMTVIKYCFDNNIDFMIYTKDLIYSNKTNSRALQLEKANHTLPFEEQVPLEYIDLDDISILAKVDVLKVLIIETDDNKKNSYEQYFSGFKNLTAVTSTKGLLNIMASDISKGNAVKALSEKFNVDLKEIIAFGDSYNDLEMFEAVGLPIAMGNSVPIIKSSAKFVTLSNDESGVAYATNNIILKNINS